MNKIQRQKGSLVVIGIVTLVLALALLVGGIVMLVSGIPVLVEDSNLTKGILLVVFGSIALLLFVPAVGFGIYDTWVGLSLKATKGSIKEGNIAKEGGTVNMKKCSRCGTEIKDGETVCSECQKPVE